MRGYFSLGDFRWGCAALAMLGGLALAGPARADVRDGVEAWSRGDYAAAVSQWQGPADAGDADAMFNLGQAYRLGRGVPLDEVRAEALYLRAAQAGHVQAADTYGLMLFQSGRRAEALPYVQGAARRGDPRAQYLIGIAHFNGDLVPRDWERAYALMTLANAAGLPQAAPAIAQMDEHIPLDQRQRAAALAREMQADAQSAREVELASVDLGTANPGNSGRTTPGQTTPGIPPATPRIPRAIATTGVSPSVAAASAAVAEARSATGTESPAEAGASYAARPQAAAPAAAPPAARPAAAAAPRVAAAAPAPATASGAWRVQLGAFSVRSNAEALWERLSRRPELAGHARLLVPSGRVTKLQAGGFATQAAAQAACRALEAGGQACLVTRN